MKLFLFKDKSKAEFRLTLGIYGGLFLALLIIIGIVGRNVIFRPWTARSHVAAIAFEDTIYSFGGRGKNRALYDEIIQIDLSSKILTRPAKLPSPSFGSGIVKQGDNIYLIGGYNGTHYMNDILSFNPKDNLVEKIGNFPSPVAFGKAIEFEGSVLYFGGWTGKKVLDSIRQLDVKTGQTKVVGHLPEPMEYFAASRFKDKIYLFGGENDEAEPLDGVFQFDPRQSEMKLIGSLPSPRLYAKASVINDKIYLVGGWYNKPLNDILEVEIIGESIKTRTMHLGDNRSLLHCEVVSLDQSLFLVGSADLEDRQLGVMKIDPKTFIAQPLKFSSYSWW